MNQNHPMKHTEIAFILDRSGSMESMTNAAISGFNEFLKAQQATVDDDGQPIPATFTLILFDHEYLAVHNRQDIQTALPLTLETYVPRGNTALLDAIGRTIDSIASEFPPSADAILAWINLNYVHPRRFFHHVSLVNFASGEGSGTLDQLLLRRLTEFESCLSELSYCIEGDLFTGNDALACDERINNLLKSLHEKVRTLQPLAEPLRKTFRETGGELLDGVCAKQFKPGRINPHRLFRYVAERGIKKLGVKADQKLVVPKSGLKPGCVVCLTVVNPQTQAD